MGRSYSLTPNRYRHYAAYETGTWERVSHYMTYNECADFMAENGWPTWEIRNDADCRWNAK